MSARLVASVLAVLAVRASMAAGAVTARASLDPPRVAAGEATDLAVEVRGTQSATVPVVPAADGISVQYVGPSTQLSIVNGQTSASVTYHFTITVRREGTFTIGPITVQAEGQLLQAGTVTLQAAAGAAPGSPGGEQLRLDLTAPRTSVYLHQRLPLTVTLWVGSVRIGDVQYPQVAGDGFALESFGQPSQRQETRDGSTFQVVEFKSALTPLRAGSVTVGPATMSMTMLSQRLNPRHSFFLGGAMREPVQLLSQPLVLDVMPLPEQGKPADFSGAVGRFALEVRAAPLEVTAGDPVTLTATLHGDGDLSSVAPPALAGSDTLRVYPIQSVASPAGSPAGTRVFEQVVIPQKPGAVRLPPLRFSWFDPEARAYRSAEPAPVTLTVRAAPEGSGPQIFGAAPAPSKTAEELGRDIVYIKEAPGVLAPLGTPRWRSPLFWGLQLVPLLLWGAAILIDRRRRRLGTDVRYARFTRAGRAARVALGEARGALRRGDATSFHDHVARAVSEYLAAKLDLPPGAVSPEVVSLRLREAGLPGGVADELRAFFATCEVTRFAPSRAGDGDMRRTLARAEGIVRTLERARRLAPAATAAAVLLVVAGVAARVSAEAPQAMFFRGNAFYADGRYDEAAAEYERLLGTGVASANTYFNLGNAYLKAGQVGRAVLSYERALRLAPGDPDLRANLIFTREKAPGSDHTAQKAAPWWTRLLLPLAATWSSNALMLGAATAWWILMLLLVARRLLPAVQGAATRAALIASIMALVVLGSSAAYRLATIDLRRTAVVVAPGEVAVRFEPASSGTVHFQVTPGTTLWLFGERDGWAQVGRDDGRRGWVERSAVDEV